MTPEGGQRAAQRTPGPSGPLKQPAVSGVTKPLPKEVGMTLCTALRCRSGRCCQQGSEPSRRLSEPTGPRSVSAFRVAFLSAEVTERRCEANPRRRGAHLVHRDASIAAAGGAHRVVRSSRRIVQHMLPLRMTGRGEAAAARLCLDRSRGDRRRAAKESCCDELCRGILPRDRSALSLRLLLLMTAAMTPGARKDTGGGRADMWRRGCFG